MERDIKEIQIDPPHPMLSKIARGLSVGFMVTVFMGVMATVVWFFVFSPDGPRWADDLAGTRHRTDKSEVTLFKPAQLHLSEVAMVLNKGDKAELKAYVSNVPGRHADLSAGDVRVRWYSENPSVAKVGADGRVTAIGKGTAFVNCVVENEDINANVAHCLVTVKDADVMRQNVSEGTKVFGGAAVYDAEHRIISFVASKKIVLTGKRNHSVTMRSGDCITDAYVTETGYLISGKFVKGRNSKTIDGIYVKM